MNRGKLVSLILIALGLSAAVLAVGYQYRATRRTLAFWGGEAAALIARAPQVELLFLAPPVEGTDPSSATYSLDKALAGARAIDISSARGVVHLRHSLVEDATFDWNPPAGKPKGAWTHALRFSDDDRSAVVAFDLISEQATLAPTQSVVSIRPISRGLKTFFDEQLLLHPATGAHDADPRKRSLDQPAAAIGGAEASAGPIP